ncbi:CbrC family protein [Metabacillus sp. SLBN-84]
MSHTFVLEIDLSQWHQNQKGTFFSRVSQILPAHDFEYFRKAVTKKKKVYRAEDFEYDRMLLMKAIIELVSAGADYTVYKETQDQKWTISLTDLEKEIKEFKTALGLPHFTYHPDVYESGSLSFYHDTCEVCSQEGYIFHEGAYGEDDLDVICVHCIASGRAGDEYEVFFNQPYAATFDDDLKVKELHMRTPSIRSWQEISWLEHCHDFCAYKGASNWRTISHLEEELQQDLLLEADKYDYQVDELKKAMNSYMTVHLFACLHCGKHRITTDMS